MSLSSLEGETAYLGGGESRPVTSGTLNYRSGKWSYPSGYSGALSGSPDGLLFSELVPGMSLNFGHFAASGSGLQSCIEGMAL
jgi:hypothetical protein